MITTHEEAIDAIGFVHERLPAGDQNNGYWFVPRRNFDLAFPTIRVAIDSDSTEIHVFDGYELAWSARFDSSTPADVLNQAVSSASNSVR